MLFKCTVKVVKCNTKVVLLYRFDYHEWLEREEKRCAFSLYLIHLVSRTSFFAAYDKNTKDRSDVLQFYIQNFSNLISPHGSATAKIPGLLIRE